MKTVYIGIGSNIDPESNIPAALRLLQAHVRLIDLSTFYRTPPEGMSDAPDFINGVARIETDKEPKTLKFDILRAIESALGRTRTANKYISRPIDLDIIVYDKRVVCEAGLRIPDPDIITREFLALPLLELDPDIKLPGTKLKMVDVVDAMPVHQMQSLPDFTQALRKEFSDGS